MPIWPQVELESGAVVDGTAQVGYPTSATIARLRASAEDALIELTPSIVETLPRLRGEMSVTRIGRNATIRASSVIYEGVTAGANLDVAHHCVVREDSRLGDDCYLKCLADLRTGVVMGDRCVIAGLVGDRSVLGDDVTMLGALVHTSRGPHRGVVEEGPRLGARVFIGRGAVVIGPVSIDDDAYIAAGAIVRRDISAGEQVR